MNEGKNYSFEDTYNVTVLEGEKETIIIDFNRIVQVKK
jgi:uncharacterized protein YxjI